MSSARGSVISKRARQDYTTEIFQSAALAGLTLTCQACIDIWICLNSFSTQFDHHLGSFESLHLSGCPGHTPLIQAFQKDCTEVGLGPFGVAVHANSHGTAGLVDRADFFRPYYFSIVQNPSVPGHPGVARVLSPDWADLEAAKEWKQHCLSEHGDACNDPMGMAPETPAWLIDVRKKCIVPGRDCRSFVALSYVWGKHSWLRVDSDTLALMQKPGALVDVPEIATKLAPIVRHAMYLTSVLEERYLWIDALCIVQGGGDLYDQLNRMGSFYASAVVTIVAADGDSKTGLSGLEKVSGPRQLVQEVIPFGNERLVIRDDFSYLGIARSEYSRRGWTYQEYKLSKRRLIVHENKLHWECRHHRRHEDLISSDRWGSETLYEIAQGFPDLSSLEATMAEYNDRRFSYEEDALPGISGLLSNWSRTFTGGFLCGLPEMFFDRSLGWMPSQEWEDDLRRRGPSEEDQTNRTKNTSLAILPSWSWLGWKGKVKLGGHWAPEAVRYDDLYRDIEETIPTTTWYTSNEARGGTLRRIRSSWYENRDTLYKDFLRPLPQGWFRVKVESEKPEPNDSPDKGLQVFPARCGKYIFEHERLPGVQWNYPFPAVDFANAPQVMPAQTQYLFCRTQKTRLFASPVIYETLDSGGIRRRNFLTLHVGPHGNEIGELRTHNDALVEALFSAREAGLDTSGGNSPTGAFVEVVIIYESRIDKVEGNTSDPENPRRWSYYIKTHHIYAVLWVEWQKGIAYRQGIGHVDKASWDLSGPEEIDLVLG